MANYESLTAQVRAITRTSSEGYEERHAEREKLVQEVRAAQEQVTLFDLERIQVGIQLYRQNIRTAKSLLELLGYTSKAYELEKRNGPIPVVLMKSKQVELALADDGTSLRAHVEVLEGNANPYRGRKRRPPQDHRNEPDGRVHWLKLGIWNYVGEETVGSPLNSNLVGSRLEHDPLSTITDDQIRAQLRDRSLDALHFEEDQHELSAGLDLVMKTATA